MGTDEKQYFQMTDEEQKQFDEEWYKKKADIEKEMKKQEDMNFRKETYGWDYKDCFRKGRKR